jgi:hypothetical protein
MVGEWASGKKGHDVQLEWAGLQWIIQVSQETILAF